MSSLYKSLTVSLFAPVILFISSTASATPFAPGPRDIPCFDHKSPGCMLPSPSSTMGKEYSNHYDVNDTQPTSTLDPEQNLRWDGSGGRVDTFDYSGSRVANYSDTADREVDGLANNSDLLFDEVTSDLVWLLFSTDADRKIYYENPTSGAGPTTGGIWAKGSDIDIDADADVALDGAGSPVTNVMDVDGLEVWGPDLSDDANRYSLEFDPVIDAALGGRVAVFDYDPLAGTSSTAFSVSELAIAIGDLYGLSPTDLGLLEDEMDLDAMMTRGEKIMWSIDPLTLSPAGPGIAFDGGEIFVWDRTIGGAASFLVHGGHTWDTTFDIMGTFGTATENINALEAVAAIVPEPESLILLLLGFGSCWHFKNKRRHQNHEESTL